MVKCLVLSPGAIIDNRYEIIAPLAEGGMGAVYRARRMLLGDDVAIKVVRQDAPDLAARERFLRESRIAARLRHPSIVSIFDFDMPEGGDPYLVMELLSGPSLREEIAGRGRLDLSDVQRILPSICAALQLAHSHGVVHRDLKPANIVAHEYEPGQRVYKLVDFGVANLRRSSIETRLTEPWQFVGTVIYAAPEQLSGAAVDTRSDIYALGAVVFEMLTGQPPYAGDDLMRIVGAKVGGEVPSVRRVRPDLPAWVDGVIAKALARDPEARWASASELALALNPLSDAPVSDAPTGRMATTSAASALNTVYEVQERIWTGRFGSDVHKGVHRAVGHPVAIRILRQGAHPNWEAARARFLREARAQQVAHESILQVRDFGEEPGLIYIVTDFIKGPTVRQVLAGEGRIPWSRLRPLLDQLIDAVRALHRRDAIICGLSPEIMRIREPLPDEEQPQLIISTAGIWNAQDLLATLHEQTLRGVSIEDVELRYVAPELLTGGAVDVRSDVFTIGVLAYEMATGKVPFDGRTMHELLGRMLAGVPEDPRTLAPDLPDVVAVSILRALRPSPPDRFPRVRDLASSMSQAGDGA